MSDPHVVLLFGLSADPPTGEGGHVGIVRWGARSARVPVRDGAPEVPAPVDEVWVLPVFRHAFHEKRKMTPYTDRVAMARLAFEHLPGLEGRVRVMETEREVTESLEDEARRRGVDPGRAWAGTVDVVRWLQTRHPGVRFAVLMGADTYRDYRAGKWKEGRALEKLLPVLAVPRVGYPDVPAHPGAPALSDISSRALRASTDAALWARAVPDPVRRYVEQRGLYAYGAQAGRTGSKRG